MGKNEIDIADCQKLEFGSHGIRAGNVLRDIFLICSVDSITRREEYHWFLTLSEIIIDLNSVRTENQKEGWRGKYYRILH